MTCFEECDVKIANYVYVHMRHNRRFLRYRDCKKRGRRVFEKVSRVFEFAVYGISKNLNNQLTTSLMWVFR